MASPSTSEKILDTISHIEEKLSLLAKKVFYFRNENEALLKRIDLLEKENDSLRTKRDYTVSKLKNLMQKFEDAGI